MTSQWPLLLTLSALISITTSAPAATTTSTPGQHAMDPSSINQPGFFVLFAFIGAGMVIATIWFFFWAKNGGFVWREGDWDDYKSTVLRRKGPDGKTLSNATKSTKLGGRSVRGGGSIWAGEKKGGRRGQQGYDEEDALTDWSGEYRDEKIDYTIGGRGKAGGRKHKHPSHDDNKTDADVLAYRAEQPARVGGLNRAPDGSHYDYSQAASSVHQSRTKPAAQHKRKGFMEKQRDKKVAKRAEKRMKEEIAKARKDRDEYASVAPPRGARAANPSPRRRNSVSTLATSTVLSEAMSSEVSVDKKKSSYYDAYRPSERHNARETSRTRHRSSSRTRDASRSRHSSPRKPRSRFPPSSYNGSDVSATSGDATARSARFAHAQVPELRTTGGGYAAGVRRPGTGGGYVNRMPGGLSDSDDDNNGGDLGMGGLRGPRGRYR